MRKQIIKILLAINTVYTKMLEPLKSNNTVKVNERYDLKK